MSDCFWCFTFCEAENCRDCLHYISVNTDAGEQMLEAYQRDVDEALKPVRDEWARKMGGEGWIQPRNTCF